MRKEYRADEVTDIETRAYEVGFSAGAYNEYERIMDILFSAKMYDVMDKIDSMSTYKVKRDRYEPF